MSQEWMTQVMELYRNHAEIPYISPERDLKKWLEEATLSSGKLVPKRNMIRLEEGLLPGHIIVLWRIQFGTYTNETPISKYFEYTYGVDGKQAVKDLLEQGYAVELSAHDSLDQISAPLLRKILKSKSVPNISKMKKEELEVAIHKYISEEELGQHFSVRQYALTKQGQQLLNAHPEVVDKHPKKKF